MFFRELGCCRCAGIGFNCDAEPHRLCRRIASEESIRGI
jgi:hypothetical protein